jgi:hypothetical protein
MDMGELRRTEPVSSVFGYDRGTPIDRFYIETFLDVFKGDIMGRVLEIGDSTYTKRFGSFRVARSDVLNRYPGHPETTFVGDLSDPDVLPRDAFDCIILTQTLHLVFNMEAAIACLHDSLTPGGVLLATVPWISAIDRGTWRDSWYWALTPAALRALLARRFGASGVSVTSYGNVLSGVAFLHGLAAQELTEAELAITDRCCPVTVAGRAEKLA